MVQGKKQLSSKPKFAEVVIGDNEAKEMRESELINNKKRSHEATFKCWRVLIFAGHRFTSE